MSAIYMDFATAFFGLAKRHASPLKAHSLLPLPWRSNLSSQTFRRTVSVSAAAKPFQIPNSSRRFLKSSMRGHGVRTFTVSAAATQSESADVLTKIPPDNRIPATIITGFLGSGKVLLLPLLGKMWSGFFFSFLFMHAISNDYVVWSIYSSLFYTIPFSSSNICGSKGAKNLRACLFGWDWILRNSCKAC